MWEKAYYSNYDLILLKKTFFDEKISAKQKGTKQTNIKLQTSLTLTAVKAVFINSSKLM